MLQAKGQAERYAKALPVDHGWPPFLLVTEHPYLVEDRRKEDSKSQGHFNNKFHIAKIKAGRRHYHSDSGNEQHKHKEQHRDPSQIRAPGNVEQQQKNN